MANEQPNNNNSLLPVGMATLFQSGWFFGAAALRNYISFIPKDPIVLIGTVYALAGTDILLYYYYKTRGGEKKE